MPLKRANIFPFLPPTPLQTKCNIIQNHDNIQFPISTDAVTVSSTVEQHYQAKTNDSIIAPAECQLNNFESYAIHIENKQKTVLNKLNVAAMFVKMESHIKNPNALLVHSIFVILCLQMIPYILIYCIDECSPLVLFSWWRNKIS